MREVLMVEVLTLNETWKPPSKLIDCEVERRDEQHLK